MLKANMIGLVGAATLGTVMLSPAMTLYGTFGPAFTTAGGAAPLAFLWALLATIPTATSYALMARDYPSSGSAYSWTARAISPKAGVWAGWMVFLYYLTNFLLQPITMGLFFNDLLAAVGLPSGFLTYCLGVGIGCAIPAAIVYRGIAPSTKGALSFLVFEVGIADVPERKSDLVSGSYVLAADAVGGAIAVKVTDMLGEEIVAVIDRGSREA